MPRTLQTVGYESASISTFITTLLDAKVNCIVDVRQFPVSRKQGFSKNALRELLARKEIDYIHLVDLGDPKPGRDAARAGKIQEFRRIYEAHLCSSRAQEALNLAAKITSEVNACLLCYERDPNVCHRTIIADRISFTQGIRVNHLVIYNPEPVSNQRATRRMHHTRQGGTPPQPEAR